MKPLDDLFEKDAVARREAEFTARITPPTVIDNSVEIDRSVMSVPPEPVFEKDAIGPLASAALGAAGTAAATGKGSTGGGVLSAIAGPTVGGIVGSQLGKAVAPDEDAEAEAVGEIFDPAHEAELTKIRTQAMMSDFMSNDPVISTYDPEEVTNAYNQIVSMAPRSAQQPAIMRGMIRKMLQQQDAMEPFEAEQVASIEQKMKSLAEPTQVPLPPLGE